MDRGPTRRPSGHRLGGAAVDPAPRRSIGEAVGARSIERIHDVIRVAVRYAACWRTGVIATEKDEQLGRCLHRPAGSESVAQRKAEQIEIMAVDLHQAQIHRMPGRDQLGSSLNHTITVQHLARCVVVHCQWIELQLTLTDRDNHVRVDRWRALKR